MTGVVPDLAVLLVSADDRCIRQDRVRDCGARGFVHKARLVDADLGTFWRQPGSA